jgi:hypothetical protein
LSKAAKHHWYDDTSPWSQQRAEDYTPGNRPEAAVVEAVRKVVIFDRETLRNRGPVASLTIDRASPGRGFGPALTPPGADFKPAALARRVFLLALPGAANW